ncbi:MAG: glycosyltransferase [Chloroflexota bacterium]
MIVRDEEENVRQCLATVKPVVDEMVVVDTGSRDNTVAVAEQMGAKVVKQEWRDDFAEARNVSLEHLSTDWVLVLDADERLAQSSQSAIRRAILNPVVDAFLVDIINVTGEVLISGALAHSSARLFRRRPEYRYEGYLHEQIAPCIARTGGHVRPLPGASILHYGYLGAVVAARDKSERNMAIVRRQVEEDPRNGFAHFNLGMEYVRRGDRQRAIKAFQRSFRLLPGLNVSYAPVLLKNLAACLLEDQRHEEALALLELGEQVYPDYVDLALLRGIGLNRSRRYREALTVLEACVEKGEAPAFYMTQVGAGSFLARMAMVESYLGLGRFDEAAESYRLAAREMVERLGGAVASALAKHAPGAAALWETAEHRVEDGDIAGAVKAYRQLMDPQVRRELLPTQLVPLWQRKALLEVLAGDLDAAYEDIRLLQGINASAAEACRLLAGVVAESDSTGDKVLPFAGSGGGAADPAHPGHVGSRLSWHDVAVPLTTLLDAGREMWFARACEWLASGPVEEAELDLELGKLLFQRGWYDAAARHLLASVRAGATDAVALGQMGELAARGGLPADARAFYRQAIRLSPKVPRYWVSLAASYHAAGNDRAGLRVLDLARRCTGGEIIEATRMALEISSRLRSDGQHARGPACGSFSGGWHP